VVGMNWRQIAARLLLVPVLMLMLGGMASCSDRDSAEPRAIGSPARLAGRIAEVAPPGAIQELQLGLEAYQPQVKILSPRPSEVIEAEQVSVSFRVQDLPLFKDQDLALGPHLHVFLDDQPYVAVYDASKPLVFKDLTPGTHTIRAFASRPWHESFKNEGAYAQTTFHVFTKTPNNKPDPTQPLLTYSRPQGSYGAEPIMVDFYLTNAPLHLVAQENADDDIADWRIRCTINGESFVFDRWQPIYLKGLNPGKNWVQLEFLNENGDPVINAFNNTVRLITYEPNGKDTLSKLVRGDLAANEARAIVDRDYKPETPGVEPALISTPEAIPESAPTPIPEPPRVRVIPPTVVEPTPAPELEISPESPIAPIPDTSGEEPKAPEPEPAALPDRRKEFFNRFRRLPAPVAPTPGETLPEALDLPSLEMIEQELKESNPKLPEPSEINIPLEPSEEPSEVGGEAIDLSPSVPSEPAILEGEGDRFAG
jgi:hypothetical protein